MIFFHILSSKLSDALGYMKYVRACHFIKLSVIGKIISKDVGRNFQQGGHHVLKKNICDGPHLIRWSAYKEISKLFLVGGSWSPPVPLFRPQIGLMLLQMGSTITNLVNHRI